MTRYILPVLCVLFITVVPAQAAEDTAPPPLAWAPLLAWLVPIGLGLLACGVAAPERISAVIGQGWLACGIAIIGYWLGGMAWQFGGVGFFLDHPDLAGLTKEWAWRGLPGSGGVLGLEGWMLGGGAATPTARLLFWSQLPWLTTAVAIPLWSLQGRAGPVTRFLSGLLMAGLCAIFGNWVWGGGWLTALNLGRGFVDAWGMAPVHLAGAACALTGILFWGVRRPPDGTEPPTYTPMPSQSLPAVAALGAWLALIGWVGWILSTPFALAASWYRFSWDTLIGLMLAAAGGGMAAALYCWLTTGDLNSLMVSRAVIAALIASTGVPFMSFEAALAVGAIAGILMPLTHYLIEHLLRLDDPTAVIATHGLPALWGLLAVGLFTDGRTGQDVSNTAMAYGWTAQLQAQAIGAAAILVVTLLLSALLFGVMRGASRAWRGEYALRLPRPATPAAPGVWSARWQQIARLPGLLFTRRQAAPDNRPVEEQIAPNAQSNDEQPAPEPEAWTE